MAERISEEEFRRNGFPDVGQTLEELGVDPRDILMDRDPMNADWIKIGADWLIPWPGMTVADVRRQIEASGYTVEEFKELPAFKLPDDPRVRQILDQL